MAMAAHASSSSLLLTQTYTSCLLKPHSLSEQACASPSSSPLLGARQRWLTGMHLRFGRASMVSTRPFSSITVAQASEFAEKEASKFREALLKQLEEQTDLGEQRTRIADTCTRVFKNFAMIYSGTIPPHPFMQMKNALEEEGLPSDFAIRAAIGWSRGYLYHDWKQWTAAAGL